MAKDVQPESTVIAIWRCPSNHEFGVRVGDKPVCCPLCKLPTVNSCAYGATLQSGMELNNWWKTKVTVSSS